MNEPGYLPRWHPYYRTGVRFQIATEGELGPQLVGLGLETGVRSDRRAHAPAHDHADGLQHLPNARVLVTAREQRAAAGLRGRLAGYLLDDLPPGLRMGALDLAADPTGAFAAAATVADGIRVVATPGHTPGHVSVVVEGEPPIVIAGDATYRLDLLMDGRIDGVAPNDAEATASVARLRAIVSARARSACHARPRRRPPFATASPFGTMTA